MCAGVVGVVGTILPAGIDEGLVHVEHEDMLLLCGSLSDLWGDNEEFFLGEPLADVVFELGEGGGTVVKKRNCMMKFSSSLAYWGDLEGKSLRLAESTASLMNISVVSSEIYIDGHRYTSLAVFFGRRLWVKMGGCDGMGEGDGLKGIL